MEVVDGTGHMEVMFSAGSRWSSQVQTMGESVEFVLRWEVIEG
jgi:hypothetical protein